MEVLEQRIKYNGKTYTVGEPTLDVYMAIQKEIEYSTDLDLSISLIGWITGLSDEEIRQADALTIVNVAENLMRYYNDAEKRFYETFTFNGKDYKFIDLKNMTFGEYIDIDTFLQKPESEKQTKLNELMALLYREVDSEGKYKPYNVEDVKRVSMEFKKLPLKYLNGSLVFFYNIGNMSLNPTRLYLWKQRLWRLWMRIVTRLGGILQSSFLPVRTYLKRQRS